MTDWAERIGIPKILRNQVVNERLLPAEVMAWAEGLPASASAAGGMLLAGPPGSGKSMSAAWMLMEVYRRLWVLEDGTEREFGGISARFIRCHDVINAITSKSRGGRDDLRNWAGVKVLVIDDWREVLVAWIRDGIDDLVDRRWGEECLTIVTTNSLAGVEGENTFEDQFERTASRILDARGPGLVVINREDLRR